MREFVAGRSLEALVQSTEQQTSRIHDTKSGNRSSDTQERPAGKVFNHMGI